MKDNSFFIVVRESEMTYKSDRPFRDRWGWEFADNIERFSYEEAKRDREEYQAAMPNHIVRIRCVPLDKNRHDWSPGLRPEE